MADIDVSFSTNAGKVAVEVGHATTATLHAAAATEKHAAAVKHHIASTHAATTATGKSVKELAHEAQAHEVNTSALTRATAAVWAWITAKKAASHQHGAAGDEINEARRHDSHLGLSQAARVGGFRHELHAFEFAKGALSGGLPGLGLGAMAASGILLEMFNHSLEQSIEAIHETIRGDNEFVDMVEKAKDAVGKMALDAAEKFGPDRVDALSRGNGLTDLADQFSKMGLNTVESATKAALLANKIAPGHEEAAMRQANLASSITGAPIFESMKSFEGMSTKAIESEHDAARMAVGIHRGKQVSEEEFDQSAGLVSQSHLPMALHQIHALKATGDLKNIERITEFGPEQAAKELNAVMAPLAVAQQEQAKIDERKLTEAIETNLKLEGIRAALDRLKAGFNNAADHIGLGHPLKSTQDDIDAATRALHNSSTRNQPPAQHSSWGPLPPATGAPHP